MVDRGHRQLPAAGFASGGHNQGLSIRPPPPHTEKPSQEDRKDKFEVIDTGLKCKRFTCVAWTCNGDGLVVGGEDGTVKLVKYTQPNVGVWQAALSSPPMAVDLLACNPRQSNHIAAAMSEVNQHQHRGSNGTGASTAQLKQFDTRAAGKAENAMDLQSSALALAWNPDGVKFAVSRKNGKVSIYDIRKLGSSPREVSSVQIDWELNKLLFAPGVSSSKGRLFASYGEHKRGGFKILQESDLSVVNTVECHLLPCDALALSADGRHLATGGNDGNVTLWDLSTLSEVHSLYQPDHPVRCVGFSAGGKYLAYSGGEPSGCLVSVEVAECSLEASAILKSHKLTEARCLPIPRPMQPSRDYSPLRSVNAVDMAWHPKQQALAFCGTSQLTEGSFGTSFAGIVAMPAGE